MLGYSTPRYYQTKHVVVQEVNTGHFGIVSWRGRSEAIGVEEPGNDGIYGKVSELCVNFP